LLRQCGECLGFADCRRGTCMCLLCRRTALHLASENGHTETAVALVKAGADVHCKTSDGYGSTAASSLCCRFATVWGGRSVDSELGLQEWLFWLCRRTALHRASLNGHTETAMALVEAGADVHCKTNDGYGSGGCIVMSLVRRQNGGGRSVDSGVELQEWLLRLCRRTALHRASQKGHTETAMALVKAGADVHSKTNKGYGW
jgi:hypothetical protein